MLKEGKPLLIRDEEVYINFIERTSLPYMDEEYLWKKSLEELEAAFSDRIDRERLLTLLGGIQQQSFIERVTSEDPESFLSCEEKVYGLRYAVIQAVEAIAGVCVHLMARAFIQSSGGYADCFQAMGEKGILHESLALKLAAMTRLRSLLVHRYWDVDDSRVFLCCREGVKDLRRFVSSVACFLEGLQ